MSKKTLVCVVGPTAIGKTAMAIQLAKTFDTEILSADSRQFYQEMTIGTAKPTAAELVAAPHHFINSLRVDEDYSAGDYERDALALLEELFVGHDIIVLVGGSGLFVDAVCQGLDDLPKPLPGVRDRLNRLHQEKGLSHLQDLLKIADPQFFAEADIHNPQRVIRALEVHESTGKPFSSFRQQNRATRDFEVLKIGLNTDRQVLYQRINARVDQMMQSGLLEEVRSLMPYRHRPPLLTVGYAELFRYLDGECTLEEAIERIKQNTRRYAKRQLTWFKKDTTTQWFEPDDERQVMELVVGET